MMRCILALDLLGGVVVRGVRGDRERYRPINEYSQVVATAVPAEVIGAMRPRETYIADLDRITGRGDNLPIIAGLSKITRTLVDAGARLPGDVARLRPVSRSVILGTETASLALIQECKGPDTIVSVDMKAGQMMACDPALRVSPLEVVRMLDDYTLDALILLDVARVGSGEGIDISLVASAASASRHPIIVGGGVRDAEDLDRIGAAGGAGAIVASAIHSGALPLQVIQ
jgi:phosphoribosylformimino-5-aminoimidazole carboxamide ribotide isomerase